MAQETELMEFRLINPTEDGFLRKIDWNKDELEKAVRKKLESYQNVVYTEDTMNVAKKDRAELKKLIEEIEDRRKQVKKIINEPYDAFEKEVKEVIALIEEPMKLIDGQVKDYEEDQKKAKKKELIAVYEEEIGTLREVLPFEKVFNPRYLNKTFKLLDAQKEIREKIGRVRTDLESIDGLDSKYKLNAKDVYIKTMDLSKAMAENKRLLLLEEQLEADRKRKEAQEEERKRLAEERKRQEEIRRQQEAERAETEAVKRAEEERKRAEQEKLLAETDKKLSGVAERKPVPEGQEMKPKGYKTRFEIIGTMQQIESLVAYMVENGIPYTKI